MYGKGFPNGGQKTPIQGVASSATNAGLKDHFHSILTLAVKLILDFMDILLWALQVI